MRAAAKASLESDRLRLVLELGQHVTSLLELDTLLPEACRLIAEAFEYDIVGISLLDPLDASRLFQAAAFPPSRRLPRAFRVPVGSGLTGWVAQHGQSSLVNDVRKDRRYIAGPGRERTRSELDVPLKLAERTIGVLNVESERQGAFAQDDVPYLQGLAGQLAQAIENARLGAHSRELAAAEERARLARDLHDETIQSLVALGRQLDLLGLDVADRAAHDRIERIQSLLSSTLEGVRRLSQNLRPAALEDLGLVAALRSLDLGMEVSFDIQGQPKRLPRAIEYAVYRVAQEALSNAARHSGRSRASVLLSFSDEALLLEVTDSGIGFLLDGSASGQGLYSMRDRAAEIGAELTLQSAPGKGTLVRLDVPLALTMLDGR